MKKFWEFLNSKVFLYILLGILVIIGLSYYRAYKQESISRDIAEQNLIAANDSIKVEKLKTGELQASIASYIATENQLRKLNEELYKEVKKQEGKVLSLNKVVFQLEQDKKMLEEKINLLETIIEQPIFINDSTFKVSWQLKYDWDENNFDLFNGDTYIGVYPKESFSLKSRLGYFYEEYDKLDADNLPGIEFNKIEDIITFEHLKTELVNRKSQIELVFGQKIEDNSLRVFIQTSYPGFSPVSLQGVLIDPSTNPYIKQLIKTRSVFPNTWTVGIGPSFGYNFINAKPYFGVGINLNYNLFQW